MSIDAKARPLRVLVVSPRFPPTNAPDVHRARLVVRHAAEAGWQAEVLAIAPENVPAPLDPWLLERLPADLEVHRVPLDGRLCKWGIRALWARSLIPLFKAGTRLLEGRRFDLVFFSTTEFPLHVLGPVWARRFRVPFCMDLQDPWVTDYYRKHPTIIPPGGRIKYWINDQLNRIIERWVMRECGGFIAVSPAYICDIKVRYGSKMGQKPAITAPFPVEPQETGEPEAGPVACARSDSICRYIGVVGPYMEKSIRAFMRAWAHGRSTDITSEHIRLQALGTSYSAKGTSASAVIAYAREVGLEDFVSDSPERIPYSSALRLLRSSGALVIFGSDDPTYTASKIFPYLLARRPLLAVLRDGSPGLSLMREVGGGTYVTFDDRTTIEELAEEIFKTWFRDSRYLQTTELDEQKLQPYTARAQAAVLHTWFLNVLHCSNGSACGTLGEDAS